MSRQLAIGDIHGCYRSLSSLLSTIGISDDDEIITLGDYVDRGPCSRDVLDLLIELDATHQFHPLIGNHELMMLKARGNSHERLRWFLSGASETLDSYTTTLGEIPEIEDIPTIHWEFLDSRLEKYYETSTHIFVHASVDPLLPMEQQLTDVMCWGKYSAALDGHQSGKVVICGHTTQFSGMPVSNGVAICLDTAVDKNGWLSCLEVSSGTIWQSNEKGDSRTLHVDELTSE